MSHKKVIMSLAAAIALAAICLLPSVSSATEIPDDAESLGEMWGYRIQFVFTGTDALGVEWDFGDGSEVSDEWNPVHVYPNKRGVTYIVTQTAWNHHGLTEQQIDSGQRVESVKQYLITIMGDPIVSFDSNGGSEIGDVTAKYNDTISEPKTPTYSGHRFGGWYRDAKLTQKFDFRNDVITESITLFAKWTIIGGAGDDGDVDEPDSEQNVAEKAQRWAQDHVAVTVSGALAIIALAAGLYTRNPRMIIIAAILGVVAAGVFYLQEYIELEVMI